MLATPKFSQKSMNKIHIILCGESHKASAAAYLTLEAIKKLPALGLPLAVGMEFTVDANAQVIRDNFERVAQIVRGWCYLKFMQNKGVVHMQEIQLTLNQFGETISNAEQRASFHKQFSREFISTLLSGKESAENRELFFELLSEYKGTLQKIKLCDFLIQQKIPCTMLDGKNHSQGNIYAYLTPEQMALRNNFMDRNILEAIKHFGVRGGIFFVSALGGAHLRCLDYSLRQANNSNIVVHSLHFISELQAEIGLREIVTSLTLDPTVFRVGTPLYALLEGAKVQDSYLSRDPAEYIKTSEALAEQAFSREPALWPQTRQTTYLNCVARADKVDTVYTCSGFDEVLNQILQSSGHPPAFGAAAVQAQNGFCVVCGQETSTKCARCKTVFYCGTAHQKQNWSMHKVSCIAPPKP